MNCPICGTEAILQGEGYWCPVDRIFLGKNLDIKPQDNTDYGKVYQKRSKRQLLRALLIGFIILLIVSPIAGYLILNYTAVGYREKIFYKYGFTGEASSYLRRHTTITVDNIIEKKPFGFTHSGRWEPGSKNVKLNTASDEVAIHEFGHAWWEEKRKDKKTREGLVNDTIKLSKMTDNSYKNSIKMAKWIVANYCGCANTENINYERVDDHHFYAPMAEFTMGKFKEGLNKLPEFMWPYFETLFSGDLRVAPCYETNSCYFSFRYQ